jgi:hypothetical protein
MDAHQEEKLIREYYYGHVKDIRIETFRNYLHQINVLLMVGEVVWRETHKCRL